MSRGGARWETSGDIFREGAGGKVADVGSRGRWACPWMTACVVAGCRSRVTWGFGEVTVLRTAVAMEQSWELEGRGGVACCQLGATGSCGPGGAWWLRGWPARWAEGGS